MNVAGMDPFQPGSDDEDRSDPLSQSQAQRRPRAAQDGAAAAQATSQQQAHHSVVLDMDPSQLASSELGMDTSTSGAAVGGSSSVAGPSSSVRLTPISQSGSRPASRSSKGARRAASPSSSSAGSGSDSGSEAALLYEDEEAARLSGSTRSSKPRGMLAKIRARAARIAAADAHAGGRSGTPSRGPTSGSAVRGMGRRERALWHWANVVDMDAFLGEMYAYYVGKGIYVITLSRALNLLTVAFVLAFSTFLTRCIDYSLIRHDGSLAETIIPSCVSRTSGMSLLLLLLAGLLYAWQVVQFGAALSRLRAMHAFYEELLGVPDADIASIPWSSIVTRLAALRDSHPTALSSQGGPERGGVLDAHSAANRIMRRSNYLIALFNKDLLDLSVPLPGLSRMAPALTRTMEWNLSFCLLGFVFDGNGNVRKQFTSERHRKQLIEGLKRRFIFMALLNAIFAPFIVVGLLVYSFFRYFEEYHQDPAQIGGRQYTRLARWKFREFNELPHLFTRRCHASYPFAHKYLDQFPKERTALLARFVSFVAGSFAAVLVVASIIDPDLFVHFDITPQRTTLFYIGTFGAVLAVARGMVPDDRLVFEPEELMQSVVQHTHYCPESWKGHFHSSEVHAQFGQLYKLKIYIFFEELLSVLVTPFVLWHSLPNSAPEIVDFFREFTVHVDGLGHVCSFAVFNFARNGNVRSGAQQAEVLDQRLASREGKMAQSLLGFVAANPEWAPAPDTSASLFLSRIGETSDAAPPSSARNASGRPGRTPDVLSFTPANSTLAMRSQLYDDAFARSVALASRSNADALRASANKTPGTRSASATPAGKARSPGRTGALQAVDEDESDVEQGSFMDLEEEARAGARRVQGATEASEINAPQEGLKDLLLQAYGGGRRW